MRKTLRTTPMIAMVSLTALLTISCSEEPDRSTKHQLPPAGQPAPDAAADATPSAPTAASTAAPTAPAPVIEKVKVEERDVRVPILVYDEMDANLALGWDKVDGPISDYKHTTWPGECAAEGVPQCKETYYGQWCQDSCGNFWGVIELVTGDVCARRSEVKLCSEW